MCNTKEHTLTIFCLQPVLSLYLLITHCLNQSLHCRLLLSRTSSSVPSSCRRAFLGKSDSSSSLPTCSSAEAKWDHCESSLLIARMVLVALWFATWEMDHLQHCQMGCWLRQPKEIRRLFKGEDFPGLDGTAKETWVVFAEMSPEYNACV